MSNLISSLPLRIHAAILTGESDLVESATWTDEEKDQLETAAALLQENWRRTVPACGRVRHMIDLLHMRDDRDFVATEYAIEAGLDSKT